MKRFIPQILIILAISLTFLSLRFFKLDQSLFFMNDIGRDLFALQQWEKTGKPPLLGPMASALPINQSPIYFYILYPFFLLTQHSLFTTTIAAVVIHLLLYLSGSWLLRNEQKLLTAWHVVWMLIAIHPQFVAQQRLVWNPSFVGVCIAVSFFSFILWKRKSSRALLWIHGLSLAAATGFSYSAAPTAISFLLAYFLLLRGKQLRSVLISFVASNILVNLPLILFELRHNFTFTTLLFHYEKLEQLNLSLGTKLHFLQNILFFGIQEHLLWLLALLLGIVLFITVRNKTAAPYLALGLLLSLGTLAILLIAPVGFESHYIFGLLPLFFIVVAFLPNWPRLIVCSLFFFTWMRPGFLSGYHVPAPRSLEETAGCVQQVCERFPGSYYVSVQSAFHGYHVGPEFHYLLQENGCKTFNIYTTKNASDKMIVFADGSTYEHGKTAYDELTLFGDATEIDKLICSDKITAHILKQNN